MGIDRIAGKSFLRRRKEIFRRKNEQIGGVATGGDEGTIPHTGGCEGARGHDRAEKGAIACVFAGGRG